MQTKLYGSSQFDWPLYGLEQDFNLGTYRSGVTEPWIANVVAAILTASGAQMVLELGSYLGHTTCWLANALERGGGGRLIAVELDPKRAEATREKLDEMDLQHTVTEVIEADSIHVLKHMPANSVEFVWLDDDHGVEHVREELKLLTGKHPPDAVKTPAAMKPGGIICMHDVTPNTIGLDAVCREFGGYILDFPHLGPAGGLGIIQT